MCGISGVVSARMSQAELLDTGNDMMRSLAHRGPDADGSWCHDSLGLLLAFRRLAIQDLSDNGRQPMFSKSGRYCIVLNGEIYNFRELAAELRGLGHRFRGHSDTEVLLAAVEQWGLEKAISRSVGMFAFGLWDEKQRVLYLCRDRLGEKPLYYGWLPSAFYFASELRAIETAANKDELDIDPDALSEYLKYGYVPAPYSIYKGIYKLPPGSILTVPVNNGVDTSVFSSAKDGADFSPKGYWNVEEFASEGIANPILDVNEALEKLEATLTATIKRQLISDVPLGAFLSGGVDSSAVCAFAQSLSDSPIKTYTVGFLEQEYDESKYAAEVANHLGTDHLTIDTSTKEALEVIPDLPEIFDEPFADSSQIPTFLVSKLAKRHVTVCLSGDGGDELFAGYNRYQWAARIWKKMSRLPAPIRKSIGRSLAVPSIKFWDGLYSRVSRIAASERHRQRLVGLKMQKAAGFLQVTDLDQAYDYLLSSWYRPERLLGFASGRSDSRSTAVETGGSFLERAMLQDQLNYLPGDNLAKVDRASMAVSLETRLPLLSHELVELSWRLPETMKVREGVTKWALREVLYKLVPAQLIERPKMGFSVPIAHWLRNELSEWAQDTIGMLGKNSRIALDGKVIRRTWDEHASGRRDHSQKLWTLLMYQAWLEFRK